MPHYALFSSFIIFLATYFSFKAEKLATKYIPYCWACYKIGIWVHFIIFLVIIQGCCWQCPLYWPFDSGSQLHSHCICIIWSWKWRVSTLSESFTTSNSEMSIITSNVCQKFFVFSLLFLLSNCFHYWDLSDKHLTW